MKNEKEETLKTDEIKLTIEELELKIAPGAHLNHNETLVRDTETVSR